MLPDTVSERLLHSVKGFVHNKYLLDKVVREEGGFCFTGELGGDGMGPLEGTCFYRMVFPFVPVWGKNGKRFSALVPTSQTLGCSWRWRHHHLDQKTRDKCLRLFTDSDRASLEGGALEMASYTWIRPLGLVLPHEGKNRVDFLREEKVDLWSFCNQSPAWLSIRCHK